MILTGGPPPADGAHYQPAESPVHPAARSWPRLGRLPPDQRNEFLCDSPKLLDGGAGSGARSCVRTVVCTAGDRRCRRCRRCPRLWRCPQDVMQTISRRPKRPRAFCASAPFRRNACPDAWTAAGMRCWTACRIPATWAPFSARRTRFPDGLFLVNACADLYSPKTVRASMGAVFRCPVWSCGAEELGGLLAQSGCRCTVQPCAAIPWTSGHGGLHPRRCGHRQRGTGPFRGNCCPSAAGRSGSP
jgi:hypothetical protein